MKVISVHLDWGLGTKDPHSGPGYKTILDLYIVSNISKWSNVLLKMAQKLLSLAPVHWALSGSNERISLIIELVSIAMSESLVTVSMVWFLGSKLSFVISPHCSLKKSLNRFALTKKSVTYLVFTSRGVINGIFEPLTNAFKNDHGFLELLWDHQV